MVHSWDEWTSTAGSHQFSKSQGLRNSQSRLSTDLCAVAASGTSFQSDLMMTSFQFELLIFNRTSVALVKDSSFIKKFDNFPSRRLHWNRQVVSGEKMKKIFGVHVINRCL